MKRLGILIIFLSFFLTACTGYMKDIRMGKTFGVTTPSDIPIYREPSLKSEVYYLDYPEAFVVEDVQFPKEYTFGDKTMFFLDPITSKSPAAYEEEVRSGRALFADRFFKARFDSGEVGYIHFRYFYPKLAYGMTSEVLTATRGETVREYIAKIRADYKRIEREAKERAAGDRERPKKIEEVRLLGISQGAWSAKDKELVRNHKVWIGMNSDQLLFSQYPPEGIKKRVTAEGEFEDWAYKGTTYYFKDNKLIRWETTVADPNKYVGETQRDR